MQVDGQNTQTVYEGTEFKVSTQDGMIVVKLGDEHAIALSVTEATTLALSIGAEVSKQRG